MEMWQWVKMVLGITVVNGGIRVATLPVMEKMAQVYSRGYVENDFEVALLVFLQSILCITIWCCLFSLLANEYKTWKREWCCVIGYFVINLATVSIFYAWYLKSEWSTIEEYYALWILMIVVGVSVASFAMIRAIGNSNEVALENIVLNERMRQQQINVLKIEEDYYNARKMRHDINKSLNIYMRLLDEGKIEEVLQVMKKQVEEIPDSRVVYLRDNNIINAVINEKMSICKIHEIEFGVQLTAQIESDKEMDVAIMLSNLLDNAIETQLRCAGKLKIWVNIFEQNGMYNLVVKNTISETVLDKNPHLSTNKKDRLNHGIGLKSVKDTVDKYDGIIDFDEADGIFTVHTAIPREE